MNKFREFYPFDFLLLNKNGEHGFYIQDTNENIRLSVLNKTDKDIGFKKIPEKDFGINNFHFMLRFRPETIVKPKPDTIKLNDDAWSLTVEHENGQDLLCFRKKTNGESDRAGIERYGNLDLQIDNLMADHSLGSRHSNVELLCDNIVIDDSKEVLRSTRQVKWPIISHRGNPRLPLHVGFVGSNTILNNGETNRLTLRISLINPKKDSARFKHDLNDSVRSKIIVTFDTGREGEEWWAISKSAKDFIYDIFSNDAVKQALAEKEKTERYLKRITFVGDSGPSIQAGWSTQRKTEHSKRVAEAKEKVAKAEKLFKLLTDGGLFESQLNTQSKPVEMVFFPPEKDILMDNSDGALASDALKLPSFFDIEISNIKTTHPSGTTNCYVRFENIPGYYDHTFVCPIQKQPIVFNRDKVGIGVDPDPDDPSALKVKGDINVSGNGRFSGNVGIGTKELGAKLDVAGDINVNDNSISNYKGFPIADYEEKQYANVNVEDKRKRELTFKHSFGVIPSLVQVWVKSDGKNDWIPNNDEKDAIAKNKLTENGLGHGVYPDKTNWKMAGILSLWENGRTFGTIAESIDKSSIVVRIGSAGLWHGHRYGDFFGSGHVWVRAWK
jgi:hypothetical protein